MREAPLQETGRAITATANQTGKAYEIGIKVFPGFLHGVNVIPAEKAIEQMNQEYGSGVVELIGNIGEKLVKGAKPEFVDHEEITISQAGIDRIIEVDWQKVEFQRCIRDIFAFPKPRFFEKEFAFLMDVGIKACLPRRTPDCYELYSVTVNKDSENEWSNWLSYLKNTIGASF